MDIRDEAVLVTGGSMGLGKELGRAFARRGARVVLVARDEERLDGAVQELRSEGLTAHGLAFDVGDKEAVHRIAGVAAALVGSPSVVVHAASTLGPLVAGPGPSMPLLLDTDCEDLQRVLDVNLVGPFRLTKALVGPMLLARRGLFVFVSSDAAISGYPRWGAYGVSKAAADHLARSFAAELDPVRFVSIDPGEMDTKMHADAVPDADRSALARPADVAERIAEVVVRVDTVPNGARLLASELRDDRAERKAAIAASQRGGVQ